MFKTTIRMNFCYNIQFTKIELASLELYEILYGNDNSEKQIEDTNKIIKTSKGKRLILQVKKETIFDSYINWYLSKKDRYFLVIVTMTNWKPIFLFFLAWNKISSSKINIREQWDRQQTETRSKVSGGKSNPPSSPPPLMSICSYQTCSPTCDKFAGPQVLRRELPSLLLYFSSVHRFIPKCRWTPKYSPIFST